MNPSSVPFRIATRGSALALAQANMVMSLCQAEFRDLRFELNIIKTTGDKLQTASMSNPEQELPKGLFTKEIEEALLANEADIAVHSLKDLPTELPGGLALGAVTKRADVRDVLVYRDTGASAKIESADWAPGQSKPRGYPAGLRLAELPAGAVIGTSSVRREAQARALNPALKFLSIRGNVGTRLQKVAEQAGLDATILAAAGMARLGFVIFPNGRLKGPGVPEGLLASPIEPEEMLPCVGQGAIGIERRATDDRAKAVCEKLNHFGTWQSVTAERAFLRALGGGCQSPVGAYATVAGHLLVMQTVLVAEGAVRRAEGKDAALEPARLGESLAARLLK